MILSKKEIEGRLKPLGKYETWEYKLLIEVFTSHEELR